MEISYDYTKKRKDFALPFQFSDTPAAVLQTIEPNKKEQANFTQRMATTLEFDCIPDVAEMKIGTDPTLRQPNSMMHIEGGWGKEMNNPQDPTERKRGTDKLKNANYPPAVERMVPNATRWIEQNNSVDMYENFFTESTGDLSTEPPSVRTISVLRDPNDVKRAATNVSWLPDGSGKLICAYSVMQFQKMPANMPTHSYVWDVNNPNEPEYALTPPSPACCFAFNAKSPDMLIGGLYNGLLAFWDVRKQGAIELSAVETSHHDPVYDVKWVQSRTNQEFCSVSTDGFVMWWDCRNMQKPLDFYSATLPDVEPVPAGQNDNASRYGVISLEYRTDAGATKYLVGTETGEVISIERKAKKEAGSIITVKGTYGTGGENGHHGPIYSVKRNPGNTKFFLTVGDWCSKVWFEDLKAPVILNRYENTYLTSANWSTTRPGVFMSTKLDGTLDVWDIFYRQDEPVLTAKISESALTSVEVHSKGKLAAVGAADGTISLLELSESLVQPQLNEKNNMTLMFERESKREKHNDQLRFKRAAAGGFTALKERNEALTRPVVKEKEAADADVLRQVEKDFQKRLQNMPAALGGAPEVEKDEDEEEEENAEQ